MELRSSKKTAHRSKDWVCLTYSMKECRLLTAELLVQPRGSVYVGFVVRNLVLGQVLLRVIWFYPATYHSTSAPYSFRARGWYSGLNEAVVSRDSDCPHSYSLEGNSTEKILS